MIVLPRKARDKHRANSIKEAVSSQPPSVPTLPGYVATRGGCRDSNGTGSQYLFWDSRINPDVRGGRISLSNCSAMCAKLGKETVYLFCPTIFVAMKRITLPSQARDKHRENFNTRSFEQAHAAMPTTTQERGAASGARR
jgi:hypothetical protein